MKISYLRQFWGVLIMSFPMLLVGSGWNWPSDAYFLLASERTPLSRPLTYSEMSLMGNLVIIASILVPPLGGVVIDKIGRRLSNVFNNIIVSVWWLFAIFARTPLMIIIGRFFFGLSLAFAMQVSLSFAAEVSQDSCRGFMTSVPLIMMTIGSLVSVELGYVAEYFSISYINLALTVISTLLIILVPESPVYLRLKGKREKALISLAYYRETTADNKALQVELAQNSTTKAADPEGRDSANEEFTVPAITGLRYFLKSPATRWSSFVVALLMTQSILSGSIVIWFYSNMLLYRSNIDLPPYRCYEILTCASIMGSIFAARSTDSFGRKVLLMSAVTVNGICLVILALSMEWFEVPELVIPIALLIFNFANGLGGATIPFVLLAEVFVPEAKGFALSIVLPWMYIVTGVLARGFKPIIDFIGIEGMFFIFAGCAFSCALFTYFMLPETKGKNPYIIEEMFAKRIKEGRRWAIPTSEEIIVV